MHTAWAYVEFVWDTTLALRVLRVFEASTFARLDVFMRSARA